MACNSIISTTLSTKSFDIALLTQTLKTLGMNPDHPRKGQLVFTAGGWTHSYEDQRLYLRGLDRFSANELEKKIRQAYTRDVIATTARRQGFKVTTDEKDHTLVHIHTDGRTT